MKKQVTGKNEYNNFLKTELNFESPKDINIKKKSDLMKYLSITFFLLLSISCFSQETEWLKTQGEITEITIHRGRRPREAAIVKFKLENGTEQFGYVDLFRMPFIGSLRSVGDTITINYDKKNPAILETILGNFLSSYGMYILIFLGAIFSIKPLLNRNKKIHLNS